MTKKFRYKKPKKFWVGMTDVINQAQPWLFHMNKIYATSLQPDDAPTLRVYKNAHLRFAEPEQAEMIAECGGKRQDRIRQRFDNGDLCVIVEVDKRIVGYEWLAAGQAFAETSQGIVFTWDRTSLWAYDGFVLPEFRLKGLWLNLQYSILEHSKNNQRTRIVCSIDYDNVGSMTTHLRFGFKITHVIFTVCMLGLAFRWYKNLTNNFCKFNIGWWSNFLTVGV